MTKKDQRNLCYTGGMKIKSVVAVVMVVGVTAVALNLLRQDNNYDVGTRALEEKEEPSLTELSEASNGDGSLKLVGIGRAVEGETKYSFRVVDSQKKNSFLLYETVADPGKTFSIPFNSWSSDNKHVFLRTNYQNSKNYFVFKADGSSFDEGSQYLDVGKYWTESKNQQIIDNVSGWAGADLLVVYTTNPDGTGSSAYWFVVGSRKFMQVREF